MPQQVRYCDKCGRMIQSDQTAMALVTDQVAVCAHCAAQLTPEQRARFAATAARPAAGPALPTITPPPRRASPGYEIVEEEFEGLDDDQITRAAATAPARRPMTRAMRRAQATDRAAAPVQRNAIMMAVGAGAFLVIVVLLWMLLAGSGGGGRSAADAARPAQQSEYSRTLEIQEKLRKLMASARTSTAAYEKARPALVRFVSDHGGRQEALTARQFIKQMDREYELITGKSILEATLPAPAPAPAPAPVPK